MLIITCIGCISQQQQQQQNKIIVKTFFYSNKRHNINKSKQFFSMHHKNLVITTRFLTFKLPSSTKGISRPKSCCSCRSNRSTLCWRRKINSYTKHVKTSKFLGCTSLKSYFHCISFISFSIFNFLQIKGNLKTFLSRILQT